MIVDRWTDIMKDIWRPVTETTAETKQQLCPEVEPR